MTTIAYRDGVLAADTFVTADFAHDGAHVKIAKRGQVLAAAAGVTSLCQSFLDWFRSGMVGEPPNMGSSDEDAIGYVFAEGRVLVFDRLGKSARFADMFAAGSGERYALGAMASGSSPEEAVRIAAKFCRGTGGDITVLSLD